MSMQMNPEEMFENLARKFAKALEAFQWFVSQFDPRIFGLRSDTRIPDKLMSIDAEILILNELVEDPLAKKYTSMLSKRATGFIGAYQKYPRALFTSEMVGTGAEDIISSRQDIVVPSGGRDDFAKALLDIFNQNAAKNKNSEE